MKRPSAKEAATGALLDANFRRRTEAPPARQHAFQHVVAVHEMVLERARDVQGDQESDSPGGEPVSSAASENSDGSELGNVRNEEQIKKPGWHRQVRC